MILIFKFQGRGAWWACDVNCEMFKGDILFTLRALHYWFLNCCQLQSYLNCDPQNLNKQHIVFFGQILSSFITAETQNIVAVALATSPAKRPFKMAFLNSRKGKRKCSCGIYEKLWERLSQKWDSRGFFSFSFFFFVSFCSSKYFWAANKQVLPSWAEHLAPHRGVQVMENQTETDVATYLHQRSCCSQGSLGSTGNTTLTFWEILNNYMELAEI